MAANTYNFIFLYNTHNDSYTRKFVYCDFSNLFIKTKMKKINVKSRIKKEELNPVFHFKDKEEDDKILTPQIIKQALKTGKVEIAGKNLKNSKDFLDKINNATVIDMSH